MRTLAAVICVLGALEAPADDDDFISDLDDDEYVEFFRTYATSADLALPEPLWAVRFHGWIYELETFSLRRLVAKSVFGDAIDHDWKDNEANKRFHRRTDLVLADSEDDEEIVVQYEIPLLGIKRKFDLGESDSNGHFEVVRPLQKSELPRGSAHAPWIRYSISAEDELDGKFEGSFQLVPRTGVSVISDIDDTIKISDITADDTTIAKKAFTEEYGPVPGMADRYNSWAEQDVVFHYVTASFWQLYPPLVEFMDSVGFPHGSFHMKYFRFSDSTFFNLKADSFEIKYPKVKKIIEDFPDRQFVLIGDSGENDAKIYAQAACDFPHQIRKIWIRNVTDAKREDYEPVFAGVSGEIEWALFTSAEEISL